VRDAFIATLGEMAANDPRVMLITGDLGFGVFDQYRARFPKQFINAGVSEQNMTLLATGMALEGHVVFTYSIANFPTLRCLEMIRNDAAYHDANVNVVAIGGGFSYGPLGISHHATEDLSIMRALPGVSTFAPTGLREVRELTRAVAATPGTCYLRLDKDAGPDGPADAAVVVGQPRQLRAGGDAAVFTSGGILSEVMEAADMLSRDGIEIDVYAVHSLRPADGKTFVEIAARHRVLVAVEEHTVHGGLGSMILELFADRSALPRNFMRIGLDGCFSSVVGSQKHLRKVYGLDAGAIAARVRQGVGK